VSGLVVVAMSGGVDSSVAAALLQQQGYQVIGITLNLWPRVSAVESDNTRRTVCCSLESVEDARQVADRLGFPHYTLNFRDLFDRTVVQNFLAEYLKGRTPNPCIRCNRFIKFDALLAKARALGADAIATGHYARITRTGSGRWSLLKARDGSKDQCYALYSLTQEQLSYTLFPLGELEKRETRQMAEEMGLTTARKPESQELCFVPDDDYSGFIRQKAPEAMRNGTIVNRRGDVLGTHQGVAFYTIGQRKGLGMSAGRPLYVVDLLPESNTLVVGEGDELLSLSLVAEDVNWVSMDPPGGSVEVEAKIRYRSVPVPARASVREDGTLAVEFAEPQRAVTPGQAVVVYQGDAVVAGGTIRAAES